MPARTHKKNCLIQRSILYSTVFLKASRYQRESHGPRSTTYLLVTACGVMFMRSDLLFLTKADILESKWYYSPYSQISSSCFGRLIYTTAIYKRNLILLHMTRYTAVMVQRKWEIFPGRNRFCWNGRLMTGRDIGLVSFTASLIVVCCSLFIAFE